MDMASVRIEDAVEVAAVIVVRSACPFSLSFWYYSQCGSSSLHLGKKGLVGELGSSPLPHGIIMCVAGP